MQVSVCDDYSLPVDFVKKIENGLGSVRSLHIPISLTAPSPLSEQVKHFFFIPSVYSPPISLSQILIFVYFKVLNENPDTDRKSLKILSGYSHPKDNKNALVHDEVNEQLCSSGNKKNKSPCLL